MTAIRQRELVEKTMPPSSTDDSAAEVPAAAAAAVRRSPSRTSSIQADQRSSQQGGGAPIRLRQSVGYGHRQSISNGVLTVQQHQQRQPASSRTLVPVTTGISVQTVSSDDDAAYSPVSPNAVSLPEKDRIADDLEEALSPASNVVDAIAVVAGPVTLPHLGKKQQMSTAPFSSFGFNSCCNLNAEDGRGIFCEGSSGSVSGEELYSVTSQRGRHHHHVGAPSQQVAADGPRSGKLCTSQSNELVYSPNLNNWWKQHLDSTVEPFLDAETLLMLRQTCIQLRKHEFRLPKQNWTRRAPQVGASVPSNVRLVSFTSLCGYDGQLICDKLLKAVIGAISPAVRRTDGITLDLSQCISVKDAQLAFLTSSEHHGFIPAPPQPGQGKSFSTKLVGLKLDFCPNITDKGIRVLLASHLPHLTLLSLNGIRSELLIGHPFTDCLDSTLWPKLRHVQVNFTSISYEAVASIAAFIEVNVDRANRNEQHAPPQTEKKEPSSTDQQPSEQRITNPNAFEADLNSNSEGKALNERKEDGLIPSPIVLSKPPVGSSNSSSGSGSSSKPTVATSIPLADSQQSQSRSQSGLSCESLRPYLSFVGSAASKLYFEVIGAKPLIKAFAVALNSGDPAKVAETCEEADREVGDD